MLKSGSGNIDANTLKELLQAKNRYDETPLQLACDKETPEILQIILEYFEDSNLKELLQTNDKYGDTPLHIACHNKNPEILQALLRSDKIDTETLKELLQAKDKHGCTPLHTACLHQNSKILQALLRSGNIDADTLKELLLTSAFGLTPLQIADNNQNPEIIQIILEYFEDPNLEELLSFLDPPSSLNPLKFFSPIQELTGYFLRLLILPS